MGQIADDMIIGACCSLCGQYFIDEENEEEIYEHGYPVICKECWEFLTEEGKKNYQRAIKDVI